MAEQVILLGKGTLAIRIAEWFHAHDDYDLSQVVPVVPEPTWTDSLIEWCQHHAVEYVDSGHYRDIPGAQDDSWQGPVVMSVFYDKIIKPWFIDRCDRILNLHNGPLPKYRGMAPINWALKNNEHMHGITIHEITPGIDDGPIVAQVQYSIYPEHDEVIDVYHRSLAYAYTLFEQTIPQLSRIIPRPQDHTQATYYSADDQDRLGDRRNFTRQQST